jgi:hypothetical protein
MAQFEKCAHLELTGGGAGLLLCQAMDVEVARAAYIRLRDVRSVELVNRVAAEIAAGMPQNLLMADVAAWQGNFDQAAKLYVSEGQLDKVGALVGIAPGWIVVVVVEAASMRPTLRIASCHQRTESAWLAGRACVGLVHPYILVVGVPASCRRWRCSLACACLRRLSSWQSRQQQDSY